MSFQPIISGSGYTGWLMLKRTMPSQEAAWRSSPVNQREANYFRDNIGKVTSADDLVSDRRLLKVALSAFGLEQDINAKAFIKKVLSDGVDNPKDLANRLADKSYKSLSESFGLSGLELPNTIEDGFADEILEKYHYRQFESAIGESNSSYRLALNTERELARISSLPVSEDTKWYMILGSKPLRAVFEKSFGFSSGFGNISIDQQLSSLKGKAQSVFGNSGVTQFSDTAKVEKLIRNYLIRESLSVSQMSPAQSALQLLHSMKRT
ncbi:DUF1217 domain-containing protein [Xinfangfangia sp. D13-10-4-6]|uniref:DUF1217 domain-containing protein n=1 Tax=Pseudogemmobacter hezensis TaxID=2737662 RepID=UPI0015530327|nr:DUF1217 domain-containing protein [Pseudogemmobacter hezensis]NPD17512.1 DUF1217 domain-containing protein [Pseudogemmobacter hezensis]